MARGFDPVGRGAGGGGGGGGGLPKPPRVPGSGGGSLGNNPRPVEHAGGAASLLAGIATPIPILWGTCKLNAILVFAHDPYTSTYPAWAAATQYYVGNRVQSLGNVYRCIQTGVPTGVTSANWAPSTVYSAGNQVINNGNSYQCIIAGTSASTTATGSGGPFGFSPIIQDGTVTWEFISTAVGVSTGPWQASHAYVVGNQVTNGSIEYQCTTGGTSASSGGPSVAIGLSTTDGTVVWLGIGTAANATPSGTTTFPDNTVLWQFVSVALSAAVFFQEFAAVLCEGPAYLPGILWWDKFEFNSISAVGLQFLADTGTNADGFYLAHVASVAATVAGVLANGLKSSTDTSQDLPATAVEVSGGLTSISVQPDVSPADIVVELITHTRRGLGLSSSIIDASVTGAGATTYRTYCDAAGLRLSMVVDQQQSALDILATVLLATNSDAVWSGGALKIIPLGDQSITSPAFGSTNYVPVVTPIYTLTPDDFLDANTPVAVQQRSPADTFNAWPLSYIDRSNDYQVLTVEQQDQSDIDSRGIVRASVTDLQGVVFPNGTAPGMLSIILAQRSTQNINTYTFKVGWKYVLIEPTDIIALTEPLAGLSAQLVRVTQIQETSDGAIQITAEDYLAGAQAGTGYVTQQLGNYHPNRPTTATGLPVSVDGTRFGVTPGAIKKGSLQNGSVDPVNLDWTMTTDEVLTGPTTTTNTGDTYTLANTPLVLNDPNAYLCVMDGGVRVTRGNWTLSGKNVVFALGFIPTGVVTADYAH